MNRRDKVLKLIVEHFIKTAQPVGSKTLIEEYGLEYSSATIRNEMNILEQDGLLEKTHTSSGRVPSSKGYRYYIDNLRERSLNEEFKHQMQTIFQERAQTIESVIKESCEILSQMTSLASIVLGPSVNEEKLISVQLVPISETSATCVFITDQGYVENKTFVISKESKMSDVKSCVELLNERLKGTSISNLVGKMEMIRPLLNDYVIDHDIFYNAMLEAFLSFAKDRLEAYGQSELFAQPEFAHDADKMRKLMKMLENPQVFRKASNEEGSINVHIAGENQDEDNVSIVSAKVQIPGMKDGSIAIVGPKRMDYDTVVSAMEYLLQEIENRYSNKKGNVTNNEGKKQRKQKRK